MVSTPGRDCKGTVEPLYNNSQGKASMSIYHIIDEDDFNYMNEWEADFCESVENWCDEAEQEPTDRQEEVLHRIHNRCNALRYQEQHRRGQK